jgi:hypothetical protein
MDHLSPADFHTVYGFRRLGGESFGGSGQVCGLVYPFTLPRKVRGLGAARLSPAYAISPRPRAAA